MALTNIPFTDEFDSKGKKIRVHIVRGHDPQPKRAGQIMDVLFARNGSCPLLIITWADDPKTGRKRGRVTSISIHPDYERKGWMLLEDAYKAEGNPEGFAAYHRFAEQQQRDPVGMHGISFPESRLPKAVQELRAKAGTASDGTKEWVDEAEAEAKTKKPRTKATKAEGKPSAA